jgi:hypothetical protein
MMARPCFIMRLETLIEPTKTQSLELLKSEKFTSIMHVLVSELWQDEPDGNSNTAGQVVLNVFIYFSLQI